LIRQALVHKVHHGIGLGHVIAQGVLCQNDPAGNHHSMAILGPHQAPIVNRAGAFRVASVWQDAGTASYVQCWSTIPQHHEFTLLLDRRPQLRDTDHSLSIPFWHIPIISPMKRCLPVTSRSIPPAT
jgi:hypothetical protein